MMDEELEQRRYARRCAAIDALEADLLRKRTLTGRWFLLLQRSEFAQSGLLLCGLTALSGTGTLAIGGAQQLGPSGWMLGALCLVLVAAAAAYIYGEQSATMGKLTDYAYVVGDLAEAQATIEALEEELAERDEDDNEEDDLGLVDEDDEEIYG